MSRTLTAPQARALRYFGAPHPRSDRRLEIGGCPRWDVVRRLRFEGLLELAGDPTSTTDHRLTEAGRAQLFVEARRRGWSLPWHRQPYVGDGADGARRSAEIDRTEADTLDRTAPGYGRLIASAVRWEAQAAELERLADPAAGR
jgi:hypothetical protein